MGVSQTEIRRWGHTAPVEQDEAWPPFAAMKPGARVGVVCRWDDEHRPPWFWRQVVRLAWWWSGVWLCPQRLEVVGVASTREKARAACLDSTYCTFALTVDRFLPRERVNVPVWFPKRALHRLFWSVEDEEIDELVCVRSSELRRQGERLDRLIAEVRAAL